jgi:hypothetical protein
MLERLLVVVPCADVSPSQIDGTATRISGPDRISDPGYVLKTNPSNTVNACIQVEPTSDVNCTLRQMSLDTQLLVGQYKRSYSAHVFDVGGTRCGLDCRVLLLLPFN